MHIFLANDLQVYINPRITVKVYFQYKKNKKESLKHESSEDRFRRISFIFIEHPEESSISYKEYSSVNKADLKKIAEELLIVNDSLSKEYEKLSSELDILRRINIALENLFTSHDERLVESLTPVTEAIYDVAKAFNKIDFQSIRENILNAHNKLSSFAKALQGFFSEDLFMSLKELAEDVDDTLLLVKVRMIETGWINIIKIEDDFLMEVISSLSAYEEEFDENTFNEIVNDHMVKYYPEEKVSNLLENWENQTWLAPRKHILRSAIKAHFRGEYVLAVPVLLAQLEGIIRDVVPHNHEKEQLTNYKIRNYLKPIHEQYEEIELAEKFDDYLKGTIHVNFVTGQPLKSDLGRNAILHGADTEYGVITNSLKIICLFDYVQNLLAKRYNLD